MAKKTIATEADHAAAARLVLTGLANGEQLDDVFGTLRPYSEYRFAFPSDELTEIAAALEIAGASRATPLSLTGCNGEAASRVAGKWEHGEAEASGGAPSSDRAARRHRR